MSSIITVAQLFKAANLKVQGPVPWGSPVSEAAPGVYVVALVPEAAAQLESPVEVGYLEESERIYWLPTQTIIYVGQTTTSLSKRIRQFYRQGYGNRSPHRGGQALLLLRCNLWVYWSPSTDPRLSESMMLSAFKERVGNLPFANRQNGHEVRSSLVLNQEELEQAVPDERMRDNVLRLVEQLQSDEFVSTVVQGHLLLEEKLNAIVGKFVFHAEQLENARLTFAQTLSLARSMSLDEHNNRVWNLVTKINVLRNALAHSLDGGRRQSAIDNVRTAYLEELGHKADDLDRTDESMMISGALAICLGFLDSFEQEVERFKEHVNIMDFFVNPHRHRQDTHED